MNIEAKPAIYLIFCLGNQKSYVGQSKSVKKRIADHRAALRNNRHINSYLQLAFTKYGENLFTFTVLEYPEDTSVENLTIREQYWIDFFDSMNREKGFNLREAEDRSSFTEEHRQKISEAKKGKKRVFTDEHKVNLSVGLRGRKMPPLTEERIAKLVAGRKLSRSSS
jgi:group I intron endonuclease